MEHTLHGPPAQTSRRSPDAQQPLSATGRIVQDDEGARRASQLDLSNDSEPVKVNKEDFAILSQGVDATHEYAKS